jgi:uncharacterized protein YfaA (DUF2138 family)
MKEADVIPIRKIPVLTSVSPDWKRVPLGMVFAVVVSDDFVKAMDLLESAIADQAVAKFNGAARVCHNFTWTEESYLHVSTYVYRVSADVYGDEVIED